MKKIRYSPVILLLLISFLLDLYVYQGIKKLAERLDYAFLATNFYWLISLTVLFSFVYLLSKVVKTREFSRLFKISFNVFITLFVTKLVFMAALLGEDVYRLASAIFYGIFNTDFILPERSLWISRTALILSSIPFFAFVFGITLGKYNYKIRKTILHFEDLPDDFDGFTIVQISDIHAGSFDNIKSVQKGIDLIQSLNPDLFVFTGDMVNNKATEIVPYLEMFKNIKSRFGKYSVLGNHDYGDYFNWKNPAEKSENLKLLMQYHSQLEFNLLLDQHIAIIKGKSQIFLVGVENWGKGFGSRGDLQKALTGIKTDAFKVLLSHDPSHWDAQVKLNSSKIHLTLSGHTHGMQFGIEIGKFKWSPVKYRYPNWAGIARENNRYLYVNRGFGFIGFAGRIGIWPEITHITLRKK